MPKSDSTDPQDIKRTVQKSDIKDAKETIKDSIGDIYENGLLRTNPFGVNLPAENAFLRAERIAAAVHLLTSHIEQNEPVRNDLRKECIRLLDYAMSVQDELRAVRSERVRKMQILIRKLISMTRLLVVSGRASNQNVSILNEALDDLGGYVTAAQKSSLAEATPIFREDLVPRLDVKKKQEGYAKPAQHTTDSFIKDKSVKSTVRKEVTPGLRSSRILEILKKGGLLGIKDIVATLPEYSEKMIQRDLAALSDSGQVKKVGEKRWSKYQIVP